MTENERNEKDDIIIEQLLNVITDNNLNYNEAYNVLKETIHRIGDTKLVFNNGNLIYTASSYEKKLKASETNLSSISCEITFSNDASLKLCGTHKIFTALFKDESGNVITTITPTWELDFSKYPELFDRVNIIEKSENNIKIRVIGNTSLTNKSFILKLSTDTEYGHLKDQKEIKIKGLF